MPYTREPSLLGSPISGLPLAPYFERSRIQYADRAASDFVHLKDGGAKGDGATDDTEAVQKTFNQYGDGSKIIFIDSGTYILTDTVTIPKNAKIVGEAWSQFAASGSRFADPLHPCVMLKVGNEDDVGAIEMQDLILTTKGGTAGVVLMEWNVRAASAGAAALWDVHARVGGAAGTGLTPEECPALTKGTNPAGCQAASLLLHLTPKASGYFDNMWLWVGDHMIDTSDPGLPQLSVYGARGFLIESQTATWLYGTASEHSVFYQYNFHNAQNIFTTMVQTESPYYQPVPQPPAPFAKAVGKFTGDPSYDCNVADLGGCDEAWAVIMEGCGNVCIGSAGTYSWFSSYTQGCIDQHTCQQSLWRVQDKFNNNNRIANLVTIGSKYMLVSNETGISAKDNLAVSGHPAWSQISVFDLPSKGPAPVPLVDACQEHDNSYSNQTMPDGKFFNNLYFDETVLVLSSTYYITIVNLTPYTFRKTSDHSHGEDTFDFDHITSGKARQNAVAYTGSKFVDDNGEAYYKLEGTDKTFTVRATTHQYDELSCRTVFDLTGMGLGQREYRDPHETSGVTLVITGSETYGYVASITFQPCNWMHGIYDAIKDRQLRHVVMPGSHDAGMSTISNPGSGGPLGGIKPNTQTQSLSIYDQLRVGSRWFDMRILSVGSGFWAAHLVNELDTLPSGATGESLTDMIADVNKFMSEYPGELIIWHIRYMTRMPTLDNGDRHWDNATANQFYDALENIENRCLGLKNDVQLQEQTMDTFLKKNGGKGCVLLLTAGDIQDGVSASRNGSGIYLSDDYIHVDDFWAETDNAAGNAKLEVDHMHGIPRDNSTGDMFSIMQWQDTPNAADSTHYGLDKFAVWASNPSLYWYGVNGMSPTSFPNVILQDYIVSDPNRRLINP